MRIGMVAILLLLVPAAVSAQEATTRHRGVVEVGVGVGAVGPERDFCVSEFWTPQLAYRREGTWQAGVQAQWQVPLRRRNCEEAIPSGDQQITVDSSGEFVSAFPRLRLSAGPRLMLGSLQLQPALAAGTYTDPKFRPWGGAVLGLGRSGSGVALEAELGWDRLRLTRWTYALQRTVDGTVVGRIPISVEEESSWQRFSQVALRYRW